MTGTETPMTPDRLLRYRDSIYAVDLLLCAIARLDLFSTLGDRPRSFDDLCRDLRLSPRPAEVMMTLFKAMDLVRDDGGVYAISDEARRYLTKTSPASLVPYYESLKSRPQCREFHEVLTSGKPSGWGSAKEGVDWRVAMRDAAFADAFTKAMDSRGCYLADELAKRLEISTCLTALDVAGGSGIYACALARQNPRLAAAVFEIPPVDEAARRSIAAKGMSDRVSVIAGDMFTSLPRGYDVHLFANAFHDWSLDAIRQLARHSYAAINQGGVIAVFDAHLNADKTGPLAVVEYSCLLMHSTEGRCYSTREIGDVLEAVGFERTRVLEVAASRSIVSATKP